MVEKKTIMKQMKEQEKNGATTLSCHAAACRKDKQCIYMIYVKVNWEINILTLKSITDNICHFIIPVIVRRLE